MTAEDTPIPGPLNNVIRIDDERIKGHLDRVVRGTVEETLNALLDAEADRLCNAQRYERTEARRDTRAGHYERSLETKAGEVTLKVPKLRRQTFETAIIERYRRREASVEEALIVSGGRFRPPRRGHHGSAVGHAGVAVDGQRPQQEDLRDDRGVAEPSDRGRASVRLPRWDCDEAELGGRGAQRVAARRHRRQCRGYREILGIVEGAKEDRAGWSGFLKHLKERG